MFSNMPGTFVAQEMGFIGLGPLLTRPIPRLSRNGRVGFRLISLVRWDLSAGLVQRESSLLAMPSFHLVRFRDALSPGWYGFGLFY